MGDSARRTRIAVINDDTDFLRLMHDLLQDANGWSLHRVQIFIWTSILAVLFVVGVYRDLAMPQFSDTLLALMGISGGVYVGFKLPEV